MILIDANLLLYARFSNYPEHGRARRWLDDQLNGTTPVGLPWPSLTAFARLAINPRVFVRPLTASEAWTQVREWLDCPPAWTPTPTAAHATVLGRLLLGRTPATPNLIPDAHLAAIAIEHDLVFCSADRGFAHFVGLRWQNPVEMETSG